MPTRANVVLWLNVDDHVLVDALWHCSHVVGKPAEACAGFVVRSYVVR
jgi:hypothetical protein